MKLKALLIGAIALIGLAACGGSDSSSDTTASSDQTTAPESTTAEVDLPDKIRIGYQNVPGGLLVVKNQGLLEAALPGVDIEWLLFDSGGSVNEAVVAGGVDFGLVGSSPTSRGISSGIE
ncbi:MAG: taurine ABC transporter substrate-binding protein, partial [Actinomycetota bacterium]